MDIAEAEIRRKILLEQLTGEDAITLKVLAAIPGDKLNWKPVPEKAMSAGELGLHLASAVDFFMDVVSGREPGNDKPPAPETSDALLVAVKAKQASFRSFVVEMTAAACATEVDFFGQKLAAIDLCAWHIPHMVHHRGQLATYLRVMGAKVPSIYGGSADENPFAAS